MKEENNVEFMQSFKSLALEIEKVDPNLVLESIAAGTKQGRVEDPRFLPKNFTELSAIVKLAANAKFEKSNPGAKKEELRFR